MALQQESIIFQNNSYRHYYLCQYLPLISGIDAVSRSLLKFKRGIQPDLAMWIGRSLSALAALSALPETALPTLSTLPETALPLAPDTVIIRALHHNETHAGQRRPSSLDVLGQSLSAHLHFPYYPTLLRKTRPTLTIQGLTRHQRLTELQEVYQLDLAALSQPADTPGPDMLPTFTPQTPTPPTGTIPPSPAIPAPASFLLIDDILTTGATIRAIIKALSDTLPAPTITIFTLAKAATLQLHSMPDWLLD